MQRQRTWWQVRSPDKPRKTQVFILSLMLLFTGVFVGSIVPFIPALTKALLFFFAGISVFVWSWTVYKDWATPVNLFAIPWLFDMGLFQLRLLSRSVQGDLELLSYVIIVGSVFCFLLGSFVAGGGFVRANHKKRLEPTRKIPSHDWSLTRMRATIFITFLIGVGVWSYLFWRVGGLEVFLTEPDVYRHSFLLPLVDDLYKLLFLSGFLGVYYLSVGGVEYRRLILAICIVSSILIGSRLARSGLFLYLIVNLMIVHLVREVRLRHVIAVLAVLFLAFLAVQYYRGSQFEREMNYITSGVARAPRSMPWLAAFYAYTIPNIRNVQIAIQDTTSCEWGRNLLYPVWSFTRTTNLMGFERHDYAYWTSIYGSVGIFRPYLIDFYRDFGVAGATLLPALIGFFSTRLYRQSKLLGKPFLILLYALLSYCLLFSFVDNLFSDPAVWLFAGMFFIVNRICCMRSGGHTANTARHMV